MGVSIDLRIYKADSLVKKLITEGASDEALLRKIMERCGHFIGESYVLVNNEYHGNGAFSPYYELPHLIDSAFRIVDSFAIFLREGEDGITGVEATDIAEELGFHLTEE